MMKRSLGAGETVIELKKHKQTVS